MNLINGGGGGGAPNFRQEAGTATSPYFFVIKQGEIPQSQPVLSRLPLVGLPCMGSADSKLIAKGQDRKC